MFVINPTTAVVLAVTGANCLVTAWIKTRHRGDKRCSITLSYRLPFYSIYSILLSVASIIFKELRTSSVFFFSFWHRKSVSRRRLHSFYIVLHIDGGYYCSVNGGKMLVWIMIRRLLSFSVDAHCASCIIVVLQLHISKKVY